MPTKTVDEILQDARSYGVDLNALQTRVNRELGFGDGVKRTTFKKLKLEKGIYQEANEKKKTFSQMLEEMDPSINYDPKLGLNAFQRQLAAHGLKVAGQDSIMLSEWYDQPDSRVLFPEFVNTQVQAGKLMGRFTLKVEDLIAMRTEIDQGTYQAALLDTSSTQDFNAKIIGQGGKFPTITFTVSDKTIELRKRGYKIMETYEHRRRIRANKMAMALRWVGWTLELDKAEDCVDVIVNGNAGNSNAAPVFTLSLLNYNNFVDFLAEFEPYEPNLWAAPKAGWSGILKIAEFKDSRIAQEFISTGRPIGPFGVETKRHDTGGTILASKILGVNKEFAVEEVAERGADLTETDKIIDGQWEEILVSFVTGYAKLIAEGARVWNYA